MEGGGSDARYAAMMERLRALDRERMRQAEARRHDAAASANPLESPGAFQAAFDHRRKIAEQSLDDLSCSSSGGSTKTDTESVAVSLAALDKMISDAAYFLPPYDVQSSRSAVEKLKQKLDSAVAELLPKKKFSFRNKNQKPAHSPPPPEEHNKSPLEKPAALLHEEQDEQAMALANANMHIIRDKSNATIVHDSGDSGDTEVMVSGLSQCSVFLRGRFRAMFFHKLTGCHVYVGAVAGSIMVEEIEGCIFMLASHQIRIHSTTKTDFYLRVRSRPIVEYVSGVRFAPYAFQYKGIEEDLKAVSLSEETGLWNKVDDFRWLRAAASPNWSVLPPEQRIPLVDGSMVCSRDFCSG